MDPQLLIGLFKALAPYIKHVVDEHRAATGEAPTVEQIEARLVANVDRYVSEGVAWRAAHPKAQPEGVVLPPG